MSTDFTQLEPIEVLPSTIQTIIVTSNPFLGDTCVLKSCCKKYKKGKRCKKCPD